MNQHRGDCNLSTNTSTAIPTQTPPARSYRNVGNFNHHQLPYHNTHASSAASPSSTWSRLWSWFPSWNYSEAQPPLEPSRSSAADRHLMGNDQYKHQKGQQVEMTYNLQLKPSEGKLKIGEEELKRREEELKRREEELERREEELERRKEKLKIREEEVKRREEEVKRRERDHKRKVQRHINVGHLKRELKTMEERIKGYEDEKRGLETEIRGKQQQIDGLSCQLVALNSQIEELRQHNRAMQVLELQTEEQEELVVVKVSPMEDMSRQYDGPHDQLITEYEELMTNPDGILGDLEKVFIGSDRALGDIVMVAYEESKKHVIDLVANELQKLFTVQKVTREMEDLSRAFGLLLSVTNYKSQVPSSPIIESIKRKRHRLRQVKQLDRILEPVVMLTWKFVTTPNPKIVYPCIELDHSICRISHAYWDKKKQKSCKPYCVRPVVYLSYHGSVGSYGLVGNVHTST